MKLSWFIALTWRTSNTRFVACHEWLPQHLRQHFNQCKVIIWFGNVVHCLASVLDSGIKQDQKEFSFLDSLHNCHKICRLRFCSGFLLHMWPVCSAKEKWVRQHRDRVSRTHSWAQHTHTHTYARMHAHTHCSIMTGSYSVHQGNQSPGSETLGALRTQTLSV